MSGNFNGKNLQAISSGILTENTARKYLLVIAGTSDVTVTMTGQAAFAITAGGAWEPRIAPHNEISFSGASWTAVTDEV